MERLSSRKIVALVLFANALLFATRCSVPAFLVAPTPTLPPVAPTLTPTSLEPFPTPSPIGTPTSQDPLGKIERDVTYCTMGDVALKMDLRFPKSADAQPLPVVINIHGGSWSAGDKQDSESAIDIPTLLARGYLVVSVNYRLAPAYKFPAQIEDVKCAVRYLRAHSAQYHLDPHSIGAWGCSAGGHLVSLLGVTDKSAGWDNVGEYADQSSRIQAAVTLCAPSDITLYDVIARADMLTRVFGANTKVSSELLRASPITYVTKNAPPFLIFQGDQDSVISSEHGEELYKALTAAGVSAQLVTVKDGQHCLPDKPGMSPPRAEITRMIADFFDQTLRHQVVAK